MRVFDKGLYGCELFLNLFGKMQYICLISGDSRITSIKSGVCASAKTPADGQIKASDIMLVAVSQNSSFSSSIFESKQKGELLGDVATVRNEKTMLRDQNGNIAAEVVFSCSYRPADRNVSHSSAFPRRIAFNPLWCLERELVSAADTHRMKPMETQQESSGSLSEGTSSLDSAFLESDSLEIIEPKSAISRFEKNPTVIASSSIEKSAPPRTSGLREKEEKDVSATAEVRQSDLSFDNVRKPIQWRKGNLPASMRPIAESPRVEPENVKEKVAESEKSTVKPNASSKLDEIVDILLKDDESSQPTEKEEKKEKSKKDSEGGSSDSSGSEFF